MEEPVEVVGDADGRQTTGIKEDLANAYDNAKETIKAIAQDFAQTFQDAVSSAKKVEMEFNMGYSASGGIWVLSGKADCALKVKITWER
jgi:hypothetical protein